MPFDYREIDLVEGTYQPSSVKVFSAVYLFWERYLFQRLCSVIQIDKIPDNWKGATEDFLKAVLYRRGFLLITDVPEYGVIFQPCYPTGDRDLYYQPRKFLVANPYYKGKQHEFTDGTDCAILKLTPDFHGVWDIIAYYAEKLATVDNAINMSIINSKFPYLIGARDKNAKKAVEKAFDLINKGEPVVTIDTSLLNHKDGQEPIYFIDRKMKENYITGDLLNDCRTIIDMFDARVGIPVMPFKKERQISTEVNAYVESSKSCSSVWLDCLNSSNETVKALYGDILAFSLKYDLKEGADNGNNDVDLDRNV